MHYDVIAKLVYGFRVALQPLNLMWLIFGVVLGNLVGVLPGLGPLTAIAILIPITFSLPTFAALTMLSGIFYGALYGGAIGAILLNLPVHPAHAVTCIDGYQLTKKGRGGSALGIAMLASFCAASAGIIMMILFSPIIVNAAFDFSPADLFTIMLFGLICGSTMSSKSPLRGISMTLFGIVLGLVGTDVNSGTLRFTLGITSLQSGFSLIALVMGLFGVSEFLRNFNASGNSIPDIKMGLRELMPTLSEIRHSIFPVLRGTLVGFAFGVMPGTGPTITSFVAYAVEQRVAKRRKLLGTGIIEGVAAPEAACHSKAQMDFIPTLCLGIPGDPVMALILGALIIQGVNPGPQLITQHPNIFWGIIASFWLGNAFLLILNFPLIGIWIKLLRVPYRFLVPCALFFIVVGVFSESNEVFDIWQVLFFGLLGYFLTVMNFPLAPIVLGFVLGPMIETDFGRALLLSHGNYFCFFSSPISATFVSGGCLVLIVQIGSRIWRHVVSREIPYRESESAELLGRVDKANPESD